MRSRQKTHAERGALRRRLKPPEGGKKQSTHAGRDATGTAQAYLEFATVMFVALDRNQRVTFINREGCELLGYPKEEVVGQNWFDTFLPPDVREAVRGVFQQLMAGTVEAVEYFDNPVLTRSGERRIIAWHNAIIRDELNEIVGTLSSGEDVTARREAEAALRISDATARAVLEAAAEGIVMTKRDGAIVLVNAKIEEMFGYSREELLGQSVELLLPERWRQAHAGHRAGYFSEPRRRPMGRGFDLVGRRKDGTEFPIEVSLSFVESKEGIVAMAFVTDITERKRAERLLQIEFAVTQVLAASSTLGNAAPEILRAICEGVGWQVGELWRVDTEANVLRWEGAWHVRSLDVTKFEARSQEMTFPPGVGLPGTVWASGEPTWIADVVSNPEFLRRPVAAAVGLNAAFAFPILAGSEISGVMAFFSHGQREPDHELLRLMADIGSRIGQYVKRRQTEAQLQRQREALHQSEKLVALGRLAAGVVHEMNNPLGIMLSRIEVMLMDAESQHLPPEVLEDLRTLHRNTQRVARVSRSLLAFARQSPGERGPVDLNHVVEETLLLMEKPLASDRIRITTTLNRSLAPLAGDPGAIQQVLINLATNAREAMRGGGEVRIETGPAPGRPGWVRLVVADTGAGIPPEELPKIFDPFYTTKADGTGLGLSVSYGIIRDHGGTVDVQSEPGRGTTFILTFPAAGGDVA